MTESSETPVVNAASGDGDKPSALETPMATVDGVSPVGGPASNPEPAVTQPSVTQPADIARPERPNELSGLDESLERARQAAAGIGSGSGPVVASDDDIDALVQAHDQLRAVLDRVDGGR